MSGLTRKHFEAIARAMKKSNKILQEDEMQSVIDNVIDEIRDSNASFDIERFRNACGYYSYEQPKKAKKPGM